MNKTLKLKLLKQYIEFPESIWHTFPQNIFEKMGGIEFVLKCDYDVNKLPFQLSKHHQQVLLFWKMLYKHNLTPHTTPLWNNRYILYRRKSIFYRDWMDNNIWCVMDLLDVNGELLSYDSSCNKYKF